MVLSEYIFPATDSLYVSFHLSFDVSLGTIHGTTHLRSGNLYVSAPLLPTQTLLLKRIKSACFAGNSTGGNAPPMGGVIPSGGGVGTTGFT
jgi:hypothetical protein